MSVVDLCEIEQGIVQIRMQDILHKNTLSTELIKDLFQSFETIKGNTKYKVVILTGYEDYFASVSTEESFLSAGYNDKNNIIAAWFKCLALDCDIPIIAAMQGHGIGDGFTMGLLADFIILSRESTYTTSSMKEGFIPAWGASYLLPKKLGIGLAQELLIGGGAYRGADLEMRRIPFPVLPRQEVMNYAYKLARQIAEIPRVSLITLKEHLVSSIKKELPLVFEQEGILLEKIIFQDDVKKSNRLLVQEREFSLREWEEKNIGEPKLQYSFLPNQLGNPIFQERYNCKWNYCAGSMYSGVSSESLVIKMAKSRQLSFFGSAGLHAAKLEDHIKSITAQLKPSDPYGMCMISNINSPKGEFKHAELFVNYNVPVIEASAYSSITLPLVYCRLKGLTREGNKIRYPRRIIGKCSRMEIARLFLSPPPAEMVNSLFEIGLINEEEKKIAQIIPMADDLAIEADSGGHTDQGVVFPLIPSVIALREELRSKYQYQDEILIGCGGGIGTPEAIAAAFMLGADFVFTGSINQCTVESGAHDAVKDILNKVSIHDTAITVAGDMFEIGAKVQVVKKYTKFHARANKLYQLFMQYNSIEDIPQQVRTEIESKYFKRSFSDAWDLICEYKKEKNPNELKKAAENPRTKMALIFKWYFAYCNQLTLRGEVSEIDNFKIYCGPAMGAFNLWVKGTPYEHWRNRNVDKIAELLMQKTCEIVEKNVLQWFSSNFRTIEKS